MYLDIGYALSARMFQLDFLFCVMAAITLGKYLPILLKLFAKNSNLDGCGQHMNFDILSMSMSITYSVCLRNVSSATPNKCASLQCGK